MRVVVNGEERELEEGVTVANLVEESAGEPSRRGIAVAVDAQVVPRSAWARTGLREGQKVELVSAIQGG